MFCSNILLKDLLLCLIYPYFYSFSLFKDTKRQELFKVFENILDYFEIIF